MTNPFPMVPHGRLQKDDYLRIIGVRNLPPLTSPFDPGHDPLTVEGHLDQSSHLMYLLKIPTASWMVAKESATRRKIAVAKRYNVQTVTGDGPFEMGVAQPQLATYLDLCAAIGFKRVECSERLKELGLKPKHIVRMADDRGLDVQFQLGEKQAGALSKTAPNELIEQGRAWLDAGALQLVVQARKGAPGAGPPEEQQNLNFAFAESVAKAFGLRVAMFEASDPASQRALIDHFGPEVQLCKVKLKDVLRVEIYRRGIHAEGVEPSRSGGIARPFVSGSR
jgi:phosphosulfolactate synthase